MSRLNPIAERIVIRTLLEDFYMKTPPQQIAGMNAIALKMEEERKLFREAQRKKESELLMVSNLR
jgi:hypothetical protein